MPIYEYRCTKCGTETEIIQSMSDPPLRRCPSCRGTVKQVFHPAGIIFKGTGFHKTDYGRSGKSSDTKSRDEAKSKDKDAKPSDAKTESKPKPSTASKKADST